MSCQTLGCKAQAVSHGDHCKAHTCRKQGCRRELVGGGKGGGRHCELHGCHAEGCPDAHIQGSSWCDSHVCRYERCLSQRIVVDGGGGDGDDDDDEGTWYTSWVPKWWAASGAEDDDQIESCKGHRCEVDGCPKARKQGSTSCRKHVCQYRNCLSLGQESGACANHTCNAQGCAEVQARSRPFCVLHACHGPGCHVQAEPETSSCLDHRCSFAGGCTMAAQSDNGVCEEHECRVSTCRRPVGGVDWEHCKSHVCRSEDCTSRKVAGFIYCEGCKCADLECGSIKNPYSEYCASHSCRAPRCNNPPDDDAPFCTDHKCRMAACPRASSPGSSAYCSHHRCRFGRDDGTECPRGRWCVGTDDVVDLAEDADADADDGHVGPVVVRSRFCEKHSCKVMGCPDVRRKGAGYCASHACGWVASSGKVCTREGGGFGFCQRHGCGVDGCPGMVCADGYEFCDKHSCRGVVAMEGEPHPVRCQEPAPPGGGFCHHHTCAAPQCPAPIDTVSTTSRYCQSHVCSWDHGCERIRAVPKAEGGFFCLVHECEKAGCTAGRRPTGEVYCGFHWKEDVERLRRGKEMATAGGYPPAIRDARYTVPVIGGYSAAPRLPVGASATAWRGGSYDNYDTMMGMPSSVPTHDLFPHPHHPTHPTHSHPHPHHVHVHSMSHGALGHPHPRQHMLAPPGWDEEEELGYVWEEGGEAVGREWVPRGSGGSGKLLLEYGSGRERSDSQGRRERERMMHMQAAQAAHVHLQSRRRDSDGHASRNQVIAASWG